MSHASLIVALSPADFTRAGGSLEAAIAHQMEPFDEQGTWFREGSRWDWWQIGGRYSGRINGKNFALRADLDAAVLAGQRQQAAEQTWATMEADTNLPTEMRRFIYGIDPGMTREQYLAKIAAEAPLKAYAFLRDRAWHEYGRLGWFGAGSVPDSAAPQVQGEPPYTMHEKNGAKILAWAAVGSAEEIDAAEHTWYQKFWERFIAPLPADSTVVMVDYHV